MANTILFKCKRLMIIGSSANSANAGLNISTEHRTMSCKKSSKNRSFLLWVFMNILIDLLLMQFFYTQNGKMCLSKNILYKFCTSLNKKSELIDILFVNF